MSPYGGAGSDILLGLAGLAQGASALLSCHPFSLPPSPPQQALMMLLLPLWGSIPVVVIPSPAGWLLFLLRLPAGSQGLALVGGAIHCHYLLPHPPILPCWPIPSGNVHLLGGRVGGLPPSLIARCTAPLCDDRVRPPLPHRGGAGSAPT